jgi:hypothetical protein
MLAVLAGLAAWGQAASGVSILDDDDSVFRAALRAPPLFSFASPTAYRGYPAYSGLPGTNGCKSAASVTGTKGEALTFTRATASSCCTSTDCSTLEQCTSGQVCISPYSGGRGMRVNRGYTQAALRSEEFDNAAWSNLTEGGAANPTLNGANAVVAPDGTTTAEDYTFPATTGAQTSARSITGCGGTSPVSQSIFVKGVSGSGAVDLCLTYNTTGPLVDCLVCSFTDSAWSRCKNENITYTSNGTFFVGNVSNYSGGAARSETRVALWGGNCSASSAYAHPYVKAVGTSVTVNAEVASFAAPAGGWPVNVSSWAASVSGTALGNSAGEVIQDGSNYAGIDTIGGTNVRCSWRNATSVFTASAGASSASARWACASTGSTLTAYLNSTGGTPVTLTSALSTSFSAALYIGSHTGANFWADGIVGNWCIDSDPARCR